MRFRLANYEKSGKAAAVAVLDNGQAVDVEELLGRAEPVRVETLLEDWDNSVEAISARLDAMAPGAAEIDVSALKLLAPVMRPGQLFFASSNYSDHAAEMLKRDREAGSTRPSNDLTEPHLGVQLSGGVVGTGEAVEIPEGCSKFDWEAELAVVIGRYGWKVPAAEAFDYVAGYTNGNDLSARDLSRRKDAKEGTTLHIDWLRHKSFKGSCPLGPWITPKVFVEDPEDLPIKTWVNGELRQDSNTKYMIFGIAAQIAELTKRVPIHPGDVILTGTPSGTATSHGGIYLKTGDRVEIEIGTLGKLVTNIA